MCLVSLCLVCLVCLRVCVSCHCLACLACLRVCGSRRSSTTLQPAGLCGFVRPSMSHSKERQTQLTLTLEWAYRVTNPNPMFYLALSSRPEGALKEPCCHHHPNDTVPVTSFFLSCTT
ncbi:unnamed protein product, partial [Discosporangium mesarthrocarpum]